MAGDIDIAVCRRTMQPFVEQQVGTRRNFLPLRKGSRRLRIGSSLFLTVQILAHASTTALAVGPEQRLKLWKKVRFGAEMAEQRVSALKLITHLLFHLGTIVAVE